MSGSELGSIFPPEGIYPLETWEFPFFNTLVLIFSGFAVTWAHKAVSLGSFKNAIDGLLLTIVLGAFFLILQMFEYHEALFIILMVFMDVHFIC